MENFELVINLEALDYIKSHRNVETILVEKPSGFCIRNNLIRSQKAAKSVTNLQASGFSSSSLIFGPTKYAHYVAGDEWIRGKIKKYEIIPS